MYELIRLTNPTIEPISLEDAKAHLRVDIDADDDLIEAQIIAAREAVEQYCNRPFVDSDFAILYDDFPALSRPICLPFYDIRSIAAITYLDEDDDNQTLSDLTYELDAERRQIRTSEDWPATNRRKAVRVEVSAGADAGSSPPELLPDAIKQSILLYVTDMYENRAAQVEVSLSENKAAIMLIQPYRLNMGV